VYVSSYVAYVYEMFILKSTQEGRGGIFLWTFSFAGRYVATGITN